MFVLFIHQTLLCYNYLQNFMLPAVSQLIQICSYCCAQNHPLPHYLLFPFSFVSFIGLPRASTLVKTWGFKHLGF